MARILLVDDEPSYRDLLRLILSEEGFEVASASSFDEAVEIAATFQPTVLVVDWMLQHERNGLEVSAALTRANPDLRTIVMSGYRAEDLEEQITSTAAHRFLAKPFEPEELIAAVRESTSNNQ